jgi:hypothetical protein
MKENLWRPLLTVAFCLALINFLNNCHSFRPLAFPVKTETVIEVIAPPLPEMPNMERVSFLALDDLLCLSYDDYRALERNVIALREYIEKLEVVVEFYRGKTE